MIQRFYNVRLRFIAVVLLLIAASKAFSQEDTLNYLMLHDTTTLHPKPIKSSAQSGSSSNKDFGSTSQYKTDFKDIGGAPINAPASPTAASLGRYGETDVNLYTGRPNIGIPLYELKGNKVSVPISLNYDAGGVKVNDVPGWVGCNWSLNAGGVISRNMKGWPDEYPDKGYFAKKSWIADLKSITPSQFDDGAEGLWDSEPDEFYFNFDGHSGKIVFDNTLKPQVIPFNLYQIYTTIEGGNIKDFTIITEDGTKYTFGKNNNSVERSRVYPISRYYSFRYNCGPVEKVDPSCPNTETCGYVNKYKFLLGFVGWYESDSYAYLRVYPEYNSAWYLSEKVAPSGESIKFSYENDGWISQKTGISESMTCEKIDYVVGEKHYLSRITNEVSFNYINYPYETTSLSPSETDDQYVLTLQVVEHEQMRLVRIQTDQGYYVKFTADHNREDLTTNKFSFGHTLGNSKALTKIEIFDNQINPIKSFEFKYFYAYPNYAQDRILLWDYVSSTSSEAAESIIESKRLFLKSIVESSGGQFKPSYTFDYNYPEMLPRRCAHSQDYMGFTNEGDGGNYSRIPILTIGQVTYPIVNNFSDPVNGVYNFGGVLKPKLNSAKAGIIKSITYPTGGKTVYNFELNSIYVNSPPENEDFVPGLRVQNISNYGVNGELIKSTNYTYKDDSNSSSGYPAINPIAKFYSEKRVAYKKTTEPCSLSETCTTKDVYHYYTKIILTSFPQTDMPTTQGNLVGYSKVTETTAGYGRKEYYFYSPKDNYDVPSPQLKYDNSISYSSGYPNRQSTSLDYKRGMLQYLNEYEEGAVTPIRKTVNEFNFQSDRYYTVSGAILSSYLYNSFKDPEITVRNYRIYNYISTWVHPTKTTESIYDKVNSRWVTSSTDFTYSSTDLQLKETRQTQSDGSLLIKKFRHPSDFDMSSYFTSCTEQWRECIRNYSGVEGTEQCDIAYDNCMSSVDDMAKGINLLKAKNILTVPIEELVIKEKNNVQNLISGKLTYYHNYGNGLVLPKGIKVIETKTRIPNPVQAGFANGSITYSPSYKDQIFFDSYDLAGNVLQYHKINDTPTAYVWGYNKTQPIAEVKGAATSEIFFTSYEEDSDFSNLAYRCNTDSHSGEQCYIVNAGGFNRAIDFAKANLHGKYIYSAWIKTSGTGTFISIKDFTNGSTSTSTSIPVPNTNGEWRYYEAVADLDAAGYANSNNIRAEVWNSGATTTYVDDVRFRPFSSQMTSYTYRPLVGITSSTDDNNRTTYYEYDNLGRLQTTKDEDKNILSHNEYNYINSPRFSVVSSLLENNKFRFNIVENNFSCSDYTYEWNFGDGTVINNSRCNIDYQYSLSANGSYPVTIKVFKGSNLITTIKTTSQCVESWFITSSPSGNCFYSFSLSGVVNPNFTYEWNFGDGAVFNSANSSTTAHQFPVNFGVRYTVTVKVYNGANLIKTVTTTVEIEESCVLTARRHGDNFTFSVSGSCYEGSGYSYVWNFGDNIVEESTQNQASHSYTDFGVYHVSVAIKSGGATIKYLEVTVENN